MQVISTANGTDSKESGQAVVSQHNGDVESDPVLKSKDSFSVEHEENGNEELDMKVLFVSWSFSFTTVAV